MTVPLPAAGSTSWYSHYSWLDTQLKATTPLVYDDFTTKSDGTPGTLDSGHTYSIGGNVGSGPVVNPVITGGAMTATTTGSGGWAAYPEVDLTVNVNRIGADFSLETGKSVSGTACLAIWDTHFTDLTAVATPCHFTVSSDGWGFWTKTSHAATLTQVASGLFETALSTGVHYRMEALLINNQAMLFLPDGTVALVTDASIATAALLGYKSPTWEPFATNSTDGRIFFYRVWADTVKGSVPPSGGGVQLAQLNDAVRKLDTRRTAALPVITEYNGTGTYNVPASPANFDATNLALSFTAPTTGYAILAFETVLTMTVSDTVLLGWILNGTGVTNAQYFATITASSTYNARFRAQRKVTLIAGGTYTATVGGWRVGTTGTVQVLTGGASGPATMTMTPCA